MDAIWNWLIWVEATGLATWVREGNVFVEPFSAYYTLLGIHSVGMGMVVGIVFMLSIRMFGYFPQFSLSSTDQWMRFAWWGFYINLVSGVLLLVGQPRREFLTMTFNLKLLMIALALVTMVMMQRALRGGELTANPDGTATQVVPERARTAALVSTLLWLGAIISGRLIGYTQAPPPG